MGDCLKLKAKRRNMLDLSKVTIHDVCIFVAVGELITIKFKTPKA